MKKRTIIIPLAVVCTVVIAFIGRSVLAQTDLPSSTKGEATVPSTPSNYEGPLGSNLQDGSDVGQSTRDGLSPNMVGTSANEGEFPLGDSNVSIPSSADDAASPSIQSGVPFEAESFPSIGLLAPSAQTWNATIRFLGSTLRPRESGIGYDTNNSGGCIYATSGDPSAVWNLSLDLPEGATVVGLRMSYYDNDPAQATIGWFTKYDLYGTKINEWGVSSVDKPEKYFYSDVIVSPGEIIDYSQYSYVLNWRPVVANQNLELCGFRLFYTQPPSNFLPIINRQ